MCALPTNDKFQFTRRDLMRAAALGLATAPFAPLTIFAQKPKTFADPARIPYAGSDDALLDEIERTAFDFFWNEPGASTGQVKDRALLNGNDSRPIASIAATGLGLSALCIADQRSYGKK